MACLNSDWIDTADVNITESLPDNFISLFKYEFFPQTTGHFAHKLYYPGRLSTQDAMLSSPPNYENQLSVYFPAPYTPLFNCHISIAITINAITIINSNFHTNALLVI